jgi:Cu(I)/Ag(I) efflux system protein CusF
MKLLLPLLLVLAGAPSAWANATLTDSLSEGEVRRIDKRAKEITIRHGRIPHLGMAPMTMPFPVKDVAMLDRVKAGDKVKFSAEKIGREAVITRIELAR